MASKFDKVNTKTVSNLLGKERMSQLDGTYKILPINSLIESPYERDIYLLDDVDELAQMIKDKGYESSESIGVYNLKNGKYEIYSGHRRYLASVKAGLKEIPCYIKKEPSSQAQKVEELIKCNLNAREKTPSVIAKEIVYYRDVVLADYDLMKKDAKANGKDLPTKKQMICDFFHLSYPMVNIYENLIYLDASLSKFIDDNRVPFSALSAAKTLSEDKQKQLGNRIEELLKSNINVDSDTDDDSISEIVKADVSKELLINMIKEFKGTSVPLSDKAEEESRVLNIADEVLNVTDDRNIDDEKEEGSAVSDSILETIDEHELPVKKEKKYNTSKDYEIGYHDGVKCVTDMLLGLNIASVLKENDYPCGEDNCEPVNIVLNNLINILNDMI